jgi:hypothetical protein
MKASGDCSRKVRAWERELCGEWMSRCSWTSAEVETVELLRSLNDVWGDRLFASCICIWAIATQHHWQLSPLAYDARALATAPGAVEDIEVDWLQLSMDSRHPTPLYAPLPLNSHARSLPIPVQAHATRS